MSLSSLLKFGVLLAAIAFATYYFIDPRATRLPFGTTDLSSVQEQLQKLPDEERELVEAYVKRSNGDVLPPQFADPDDPLTARTFAEAIELQRRWLVKRAEADEKAAVLKEQRKSKLAPLRELVMVSLIKSEIITRSEYEARRNPGSTRRKDDAKVFVNKIRIDNLTNEKLLALQGSIKAWDHKDYNLPIDLCWLDKGSVREMEPHTKVELLCGQKGGVSDQMQDFISNPDDPRFEVEWIPQYLQFASGREVSSGVNW